MKKAALLLIVVLLFLLCIRTDSSAEIFLEEYVAHFQPLTNAAGRYSDIAVKLDIHYRTTGESLRHGFKFVGSRPVKDVRVSDEEGLINFTVNKLNEYKIDFSFKPVKNREKMITVEFVIKDAISDAGLYGSFDADWVGNWKIPVRSAKYSVMFPQGYKYLKISSNLPYTEVTAGGRLQLQFSGPLTAGEPLRVSFVPGFNTAVLSFYLTALLINIYLFGYMYIRRKRIPVSRKVDASEPTPAEVAYLKSGLKHAVSVSAFDLLRRGFLMPASDEGGSWDLIKYVENRGALYQYELILAGFFRKPAAIRAFIQSGAPLKSFDFSIVESLSKKGCLKDLRAEKSFAAGMTRNSLFSIMILVVLGIVSGVFAWSLWLLPLSMLMPAWGLIYAARLRSSHPLSERGQEAVAKHQYLTMKNEESIFDKDKYSPALSYAIAVSGLAVLDGSIFSDQLDYVSIRRSFSSGKGGTESMSCSSCGSSSTASDAGSGSGDSGGSSGCSSCGGCGGGD